MSQPGQRQYEVVTNAKFPFHPPKIREKRSKKGSKHKLGDPKKEEEVRIVRWSPSCSALRSYLHDTFEDRDFLTLSPF